MTKIIAVVSGKGGVGKSTTVANLGIALAEFGKDVTVIDANFSTPDLTLHFGSPIGMPTLHHIMTGKYTVERATHVHPSGMKLIPASLSILDMKQTRYSRLEGVLRRLHGDFIILDTQAGLSSEVQSAMAASDEVLVVTNPEWPAITDALKTILIAREHGVKITGVVLNRVRKEKIEPNMSGIEAVLEAKIIAVIPDDHSVKESIAAKNPVILSHPHSDAAVAFRQLAARIAEVKYNPPSKFSRRVNGILKKLVK